MKKFKVISGIYKSRIIKGSIWKLNGVEYVFEKGVFGIIVQKSETEEITDYINK